MTMRKVPYGGAWMPHPINLESGAAVINQTLTLTEGEWTRVAYTFTCPASGVLEQFEFFMDYGSSNSATTLKVIFEDLDSDGVPDGGADEFRVIELGDISSSWVTPGIMSSDGTDTGTLRTVTRGQKLAVVIEFDSASTGDIITFGTIATTDGLRRMPAGAKYYDVNEDAWFYVGHTCAVGALRYEGGLYYPMPEFIPITGFTEITLNTGTTPDEVGIEFSIHTDVLIGGAAFCLSTVVDGVGTDCVLYDPSGTAVETVAMKLYPDIATGFNYWTAKFSQDRRITANEIWRLTIRPSSASSIKLLDMSFNDSVILEDLYQNGNVTQVDAVTDNAAYFKKTSRTNGGNWDAPVANAPLISLHVTGIEQVTGGATNDWTGDA